MWLKSSLVEVSAVCVPLWLTLECHQVRRGARHPRSRGLWLPWRCRGSVAEWQSRSRGLPRPRQKQQSTRNFWLFVLRSNVIIGVRVWRRNARLVPPSLSPRPRWCLFSYCHNLAGRVSSTSKMLLSWVPALRAECLWMRILLLQYKFLYSVCFVASASESLLVNTNACLLVVCSEWQFQRPMNVAISFLSTTSG